MTFPKGQPKQSQAWLSLVPPSVLLHQSFLRHAVKPPPQYPHGLMCSSRPGQGSTRVVPTTLPTRIGLHRVQMLPNSSRFPWTLITEQFSDLLRSKTTEYNTIKTDPLIRSTRHRTPFNNFNEFPLQIKNRLKSNMSLKDQEERISYRDLKVNRNSGFSSVKQLDKYSLYNERLQKMYKKPADVDSAHIHKAAAAFGFNRPFKKGQSAPVCPCCLLPVNTEELTIDTSTTPAIEQGTLIQPFFLSSGTSLSFSFIKFITLYLFVLFLTVSIFPMSMSIINNDYCQLQEAECGKSWFIGYSPAKQGIPNHQRFLVIGDYLNFIMVLLSIVLFRFYRRYQHDVYYTLRRGKERQQDYTLIVRNIPQMIHSADNNTIHFNYEQTLKELFQDKIRQFFNQQIDIQHRTSLLQNFQEEVIGYKRVDPFQLDIVKSISLCFDLSDLQKIQKFREQLIQELPTNNQQDEIIRESMMNPNNKLKVINEQYLELCKSFCLERNLNWTLTRFLGVAFVSFEFEHYRNYLVELYQNNPSEFKINNKPLVLGYAPKPESIEWFDLQIEDTDKVKSFLISYLGIFFILLTSFLLVLGLQSNQFPLRGRQVSPFHHQPRPVSFGHHMLIAGIIYFINYVLRKVIAYMTFRESHQTRTKRLKATLTKSVVAQVANTTVIYVILSLLQGEVYLRDDGIVVQTSYFILLMGPIQLVLNFFQIDKKLQQLVITFLYGPLRPDRQVQIKYNKRFQLPEFAFTSRLSHYLTLLYFVLFFSYINPLLSAVAMLLFFISYWIDKYNLFKCSSRGDQLNFGFSLLVLRLLEGSLLFLAGGNLYYSWSIQKKGRAINIIGFGLVCLYLLITLFAPRWLERKCCHNARNEEPDSYSSCIQTGKFQHTYWLSNPATMFTQQPDINHQDHFIDTNFSYHLASRSDLSRSRRG